MTNLHFYQGDKLATIKQGETSRTVLRGADVPLAELHVDATPGSSLLATDNNGSVLKSADEEDAESHAYSAYGHDPTLPSAKTLLGFNGEYYDHVTQGTPLGSGFRTYSATLLRFQTPDSWSPFAAGGLNTYCYCLGDPVNRVDPSGHIGVAILAKAIIKFRRLRLQLPGLVTNGQWSRLITPIARSNDRTAYVMPTVRSGTARPLNNVSAPAQMAQQPLEPVPTLGQTAWPAGATNGLVEAVSAMPDHRSRPHARILPTRLSDRAIPQARYHSDSSSSSGSSRDSTPSSSRSASPASDHNEPDFVQRAMSVRRSNYYSRKFD